MLWKVLDDSQRSVAFSSDGINWQFVSDKFKSEFETLLIEGIARGRKNYVAGDEKFDELFWEEVKSMGYEVEVEADGETDVVLASPPVRIMEVNVMPKAMLEKLPAEAKKVYEEAYKNALKTYDDDEEKASRVAITAVKNAGYKKDEDSGNWVKEKMQAISMHFTKASLDPDSGEMRWAATVSKFEEDDQGDEVTPEFYKSAIAVVERGLRPKPVLCVSHVDRGAPNDNWVAGDTVELFIDGDLPKAKGTFRDTPLGQATFEAVRSDIKDERPHEERARISMGFYDEGSTPKGEGSGRKFIQGWIKHLAVTRVPVVKETELSVKSEGEVKTIKDDATSIIGEELASKLLADGENPTQDKSLVTKQDGTQAREDQVDELIGKLLDILSDGPEIENLDVDAVRRALGNRGTNPPRAETAKGEAELTEQVDQFVNAFSDHVKSTLLSSGDRTEKFQAIQQGLDQFGEGVERLVKGATPPSSQDISETVRSAVEKAVAPLQSEIIQLKAQMEAGERASVSDSPAQPRSMDGRVAVQGPPIPAAGGLAEALNTGMKAKARTAAEIAWESTREPAY